MHHRSFDDNHAHDRFLDAQARAVIEAEFEEISPARPRKAHFLQTMEAWSWIKQRLNRR
jgi:hypothetical protein